MSNVAKIVDTVLCTTNIELHKTNFTCSTRDQTRKRRLKLTLVRLQTWSLTALGEGMKILCIKDHVRSTINDFHEGITNASYILHSLRVL